MAYLQAEIDRKLFIQRSPAHVHYFGSERKLFFSIKYLNVTNHIHFISFLFIWVQVMVPSILMDSIQRSLSSYLSLPVGKAALAYIQRCGTVFIVITEITTQDRHAVNFGG